MKKLGIRTIILASIVTCYGFLNAESPACNELVKKLQKIYQVLAIESYSKKNNFSLQPKERDIEDCKNVKNYLEQLALMLPFIQKDCSPNLYMQYESVHQALSDIVQKFETQNK